MHDIILYYVRDPQKQTFNISYEEPAPSTQRVWQGQKQILIPGATKKIKSAEKSKGLPQRDVFDISIISGRAKERLGYPTQKPRALLERIIQASSNKSDIVLDPFAGCATTCAAAEYLERQWIGIDLSPLAYTLIQDRLANELQLTSQESPRLTSWQVHHRIFPDLPVRSDIDTLPPYTTHKHTLFGQQEGRCGGCRMDFPFKLYEVDHIVPKSKGGTDAPDNLQLLCGHCNKTKGSQSQAYLVSRLRQLGYLNQS